ncbi:damage-control phosphatase ARMT1-like [Eupeodes corollae]|uniref:damage-control phosphatase ARMT1-like n=1 Tax=Eupeodes corollae TaxID=290404 RepID=UPI0024911285|nr:damage-control phosphatase ARMT1-like [Eupeodes corollae]
MTTAAEFDKKYDIVDEKPPRHTVLRGRFKRSFAYYTLRERLPVILTQVLDNLSRDKDEIAEKYGNEVREEIKEIVGNISKLKYQLQTDKALEPFAGNEPDKEMWNAFIAGLTADNDTFFRICWLHGECYMYRRLSSYFECTDKMRDYDYFQKQKENALTCCTDALENVVNSTRDSVLSEEFFIRILKLNLWGNRCDLSISEGKEIKQTGNLFDSVDSLNSNILVDDTKHIWNCISKPLDGKSRIIDFVQDNSGFELFTDLLVAEYLIDKNLATKIRFHVKAIPWFISDVRPRDFLWTLDYLRQHPSSTVLKAVGEKWYNFLQDGKFEIAPIEWFWTSPYEYYRMKEINENLYNKLAESHIVIFKGDLNYRKLIGDFMWDFTEDFKTCLRGFQPTNVCTLRTVKADLICGLKEGTAENLDKIKPDWMVTGEFGVLQFSSST